MLELSDSHERTKKTSNSNKKYSKQELDNMEPEEFERLYMSGKI